MAHLGARLKSIEPGVCEIELPFRPELTQQHGFFHAGVVATLLDNTGGYAAFSLMPQGTSVLTVEFKLNRLAPASGDLLVARSSVLKPGKTLTVCRGEAWVQKGGDTKTCAACQMTIMAMPGMKDTPPG